MEQHLYVQIKHWLVRQIETGQLPEGTLLPPEQALATRFGVSRPTVRQAILELVHEGLVVRVRGRGTTVLRRRLEYPSRRLLSFSEEYLLTGQQLTAKVLDSGLRRADEALEERMGLESGTDVFFLSRLRYVAGQPVAWQRSQIPANLVPGIDLVDFTNRSLYAHLSEQYGFAVAYADERIRAGQATREEAPLLRIASGDPVLRIERRSFSASGSLAELVDSVYRGDRYEIRLRLTR
jgi:GntR family transcriptional regulator